MNLAQVAFITSPGNYLWCLGAPGGGGGRLDLVQAQVPTHPCLRGKHSYLHSHGLRGQTPNLPYSPSRPYPTDPAQG